MIKPDKFTKLNNNVIFTSAIIIKLLLENNYSISYEKLYKHLELEIGDNSLYLFLPTVDFLFLLGKLKYNKTNDKLELII